MVRPMYVRCKKCGHIFSFYPEGGKIFCPKCLTPADPSSTVDDGFTAVDTLLSVIGKIKSKKRDKWSL